MNQIPSLTVRVRRIAPEVAAQRLGSRSADFIFWRETNFVIGEGVAASHSSATANRTREHADWWQLLVKQAQIVDEVGLPGSGLLAFAGLTFSNLSQLPSSLWVAQRTTVQRGDLAWEVEIDSFDPVSSVARAGSAAAVQPTVTFRAGSQDEAGFRTAVSEAINRIRAGSLNKVVLARDLIADLPSGFSPQAALERLHERYPTCWNYLIGDQIGASPELLLRAERDEISARVLAGTAGRGTDPDVDMAIAAGLRSSLKNLQEHEFAIDSMVSQLQPISEVVSADPNPHSAALPDLWHLASDVTAKLKAGVSVFDAIERIHPTAAVAGTPRQDALNLIAELEPFDRGGYAGPVGWLASDGSAEFALALRGGRFESETQLRAFAGSGIVAGSDPESELAETELKFQAIRWAVGTQ